jgi:outer membrane protein TolC
MVNKSILYGLVMGIVLLFFASGVRAQNIDSTKSLLLSEGQLLAIVKNFHPYLQQAKLRVNIASAAITESRGAFDPVLQTAFDRKTFDDKLYYSYFNPELVVPTWYGIELYGGLENVLGEKVNTESSLGKTSYLGISVPVARDLVLDKRRAILRQAILLKQQSQAEQLLVENDILYGALTAYWNWVREYQAYQIIGNVVALNAGRYRLVCIEAQQGARPAIDTVEALAQLQQFQFMQSDALLKFQNAGLDLADFLWLKETERFPWNNHIRPDSVWLEQNDWRKTPPPLEELVRRAALEHPKLQSYKVKTDWLRVEKKLKFQSLLPKADLKYNLLNKGYYVFDQLDGALLQNNYKFGFSFQMPLILRQGRGAYQQTVFKIKENELQIDQYQLEIENKLKIYYNEVFTLASQIALYELNLQNYQQLLKGEDLRFRLGESSLFLLNARENKALEVAQKLIELKTKWYKSYAALSWAQGRLGIMP